jgi:hypothetical protein
MGFAMSQPGTRHFPGFLPCDSQENPQRLSILTSERQRLTLRETGTGPWLLGGRSEGFVTPEPGAPPPQSP